MRSHAGLGCRAYLLLVAALLAFFLLAFLVAEALGVPLLTDPGPALRNAGALAAVVGVGLLLADVVLPVPASLVMISHGALFGVAIGSLLSLLGGLGVTLLAFLIGRRSRGALDRLAAPERRANDLLARYGTLAIVVTRPVPMLAETVAILAGTSRLSWRKAALAGAAGNLAPAVLYAVTGAVAANAVSGAVVFGVVLLVAWPRSRDEAAGIGARLRYGEEKSVPTEQVSPGVSIRAGEKRLKAHITITPGRGCANR